MKYSAILTLALALGPASAFSAGLVSAFDFSGNLNPFFDGNPGNVLPLVHLNGAANPTPTASTFSTALVGSTTKQVLNFALADTLHAFHGVGANGGGSYVNQYTIVLDVKFDAQALDSFSSLFNTNATNSNDGDSFLRWDSTSAAAIGTGGEYGGSISADTWHRLAIAVDESSTGSLTYFLDGVQIHQSNPGVSLDGRYALYTYNDGDTDDDGVYILGDDSGDNASGQLSQLAFYDHNLSAAEVEALGVVGSPVPEPATLAALGLGVAAFLRRRRSAK